MPGERRHPGRRPAPGSRARRANPPDIGPTPPRAGRGAAAQGAHVGPTLEHERVPRDTAKQYRDSRAVLELLGYDEDEPSSIVGALSAAWENAGSTRKALSAEIWECLNSTHNSLQARVAAARDFGPAPFFSYVRERAASVAGYVEASMSRDASYDALVLGRSLERADMTARLLAARISAARGSEGWTSTLRACSAHDAYLRTYQQGVNAPAWWSSSWWTGSSPGQSSPRSGQGKARWPGWTRRPGAPGWTNRPVGRSAGRAPTWSSFTADLPRRPAGPAARIAAGRVNDQRGGDPAALRRVTAVPVEPQGARQ